MHTFFHSLTYSMLLLVFLPVLSLPVSAQTVPDKDGNYYSNESRVRAAVNDSFWRVAVDELNCRRSASINSDVVRTYLSGELLEVEVYRGGSDEVLLNSLDKNGKPWMPVRGKNIESVCYVRANSRYIQPFTAR